MPVKIMRLPLDYIGQHGTIGRNAPSDGKIEGIRRRVDDLRNMDPSVLLKLNREARRTPAAAAETLHGRVIRVGHVAVPVGGALAEIAINDDIIGPKWQKQGQKRKDQRQIVFHRKPYAVTTVMMMRE
jgi:hypothetical protein